MATTLKENEIRVLAVLVEQPLIGVEEKNIPHKVRTRFNKFGSLPEIQKILENLARKNFARKEKIVDTDRWLPSEDGIVEIQAIEIEQPHLLKKSTLPQVPMRA